MYQLIASLIMTTVSHRQNQGNTAMRYATFAVMLMLSVVGVTLSDAQPAAAMSATQIGTDIDGEAPGDFSGFAVAISGDGESVIVGAPFNAGTGIGRGHARVFRFDGTDWTQFGSDIDGGDDGDRAGWAVAISDDGNTVIIGAPESTPNGPSSGRAKVYRHNGVDWAQIGEELNGDEEDDFFGESVAMSADGNTVAVGAAGTGQPGASPGEVKIFRFDGVGWRQLGATITGDGDQRLGFAVALSADGDIIAIGAPGNPLPAPGRVRILEWTGAAWSQLGADVDGTGDDTLGYAVALSADGLTVIAGSPGADTARVFHYTTGSWNQVGADLPTDGASEFARTSVDISADGNIVAIGGPAHGGLQGPGHTRVFSRLGQGWSQLTDDIDGEAAGDSSGTSVSLSADGTTVITGAWLNDGNGADSGHARVFDVSQVPECDGLPATVFGAGVINGTGGPDVIVGSPGPDTITGFGGDDIICGRGGNDIIIDFAGNDRLFGGPGNDRITGGNGDDMLFGGPGDDVLKGEGDNDIIWGGNDDDDLVGGTGNDVMRGGFGDDRFRGGPGTDTADYTFSSGPVTVSINNTPDDGTLLEADDVQVSVEEVTGSIYNDTLIGSNGPNTLRGNRGDDRIIGRAGNDRLFGGPGSDFVIGGADDDTINGGQDTDRCIGGAGADTTSSCEIDQP